MADPPVSLLGDIRGFGAPFRLTGLLREKALDYCSGPTLRLSSYRNYLQLLGHPACCAGLGGAPPPTVTNGSGDVPVPLLLAPAHPFRIFLHLPLQSTNLMEDQGNKIADFWNLPLFFSLCFLCLPPDTQGTFLSVVI